MNYMVRHGLSVAEALHVFAKHRPPGIYKADYIDALFKYNHELPCEAPAYKSRALPASFVDQDVNRPTSLCHPRRINYSFPMMPDWKPAEADGDEDESAVFAPEKGASAVCPNSPASALLLSPRSLGSQAAAWVPCSLLPRMSGYPRS